MKSQQKLLLTTGVVLSTVFVWLLLFVQQLHQPSLPILGLIPNFKLYDTTGKEFTLKELKDNIFVTDFIFTTCAGICPMMSQNMSELYNSHLSEPNIEFVSISVNPEYDSPQILAQYAKRYRADTNKWHFLTGAREEITNLTVNGFKIGTIEEPTMHSGYFVLVDKKSRIRGYYDGTKADGMKKLADNIALLLREKN